jgi:hypothetical protein
VDIDSFPHRVIRLTFDTGQRYEAFRARYEDAVPELDSRHLADFVDRGAPWREVVKDADASAPLGFFIYWRSDLTPLMSLAGDSASCTANLMGNHTIAEQMYRHDPSVMRTRRCAPPSTWTPRTELDLPSLSLARCSIASPVRRSHRSASSSTASSTPSSRSSTCQYEECSMVAYEWTGFRGRVQRSRCWLHPLPLENPSVVSCTSVFWSSSPVSGR